MEITSIHAVVFNSKKKKKLFRADDKNIARNNPLKHAKHYSQSHKLAQICRPNQQQNKSLLCLFLTDDNSSLIDWPVAFAKQSAVDE